MLNKFYHWLKDMCDFGACSRRTARLRIADVQRQRLDALEDNLALLAVGLDSLRQRVGGGQTAGLTAAQDKSIVAVADRNILRTKAHFEDLEARVAKLENSSAFHLAMIATNLPPAIRPNTRKMRPAVKDSLRAAKPSHFKIAPADRHVDGSCDRWEIWDLNRPGVGCETNLMQQGRSRRDTITALRQQFPGCKITVCR